MESDNQSSSNGPSESGAQTEAPGHLHAEIEKWKNEFLYLRAEFENYKRNAIKERSDLIKYGAERFAREILNVQDNFERALSIEMKPENFDTYVKGVQMTATELKQTLAKFGVVEQGALGETFNPNHHEALGAEPHPEFKSGQICRIIKKAYFYHDRLLRPAQVIVAKDAETQGHAQG